VFSHKIQVVNKVMDLSYVIPLPPVGGPVYTTIVPIKVRGSLIASQFSDADVRAFCSVFGPERVKGLGLKGTLKSDPRTNRFLALHLGLTFSETGSSFMDVTPKSNDAFTDPFPPRISPDVLRIMAMMPFSFIVSRYGTDYTVEQMVQNGVSSKGYTWFQGSPGAFNMVYSKVVKDAPRVRDSFLHNIDPVYFYVLFQVYGPTPRHIKYQVSRIKHEGELFSSLTHNYVLKEGEADGSFNVELGISNQVYDSYVKRAYVDPTFLDPQYYATSSYSRDTFFNHMDQARALLSNVPEDHALIAPGDGIGIIARLWKGDVIVGDLHTLRVSHEAVVRESITRTLLRGRDYEGPKTLILSYVDCFLTQEDKDIIAEMTCPIIVLDFQHIVYPYHGMVIMGPGAMGYRGAFSVSFEREKRNVEPPLNYTNNLLTLSENLELVSLNDSTRYLATLAPGKPYIVSTTEFQTYLGLLGCANVRLSPIKEFKIKVCNFVSEVVDSFGQHVYFCPIGREVWVIPHVDLLNFEELETRVLYSCDDVPLHHIMLENVAYYLYGTQIYFYSFADCDCDFSYYSVLPNRTMQGTVKFRKKMNYSEAHGVLRMVPGKASHTVYIFQSGKDFTYEGKIGQTAKEVSRKIFPNLWCPQLEYYLRKTMKEDQYLILYNARDDVHKWQKISEGRLKRKKK